MTREEFIDQYIRNSGLEEYRTPDGFTVGEFVMVARPCDCGNEICRGWKMVNAADGEPLHQFFAGLLALDLLRKETGWD